MISIPETQEWLEESESEDEGDEEEAKGGEDEEDEESSEEESDEEEGKSLTLSCECVIKPMFFRYWSLIIDNFKCLKPHKREITEPLDGCKFLRPRASHFGLFR